MNSFNVFDAVSMIGRRLTLREGGAHTVADLLRDLDHFGIAEALVLDCLGRENHPAEGNTRVLEAVAAEPRLHPAWSALPTGAADEQPSGGECVRRMRDNGVGALFLYPRQYRFTLDDWCIDALVGPLAEARVPVFINYNEVVGSEGWPADETDWPAVVALCRRWPRLPVIVGEYRVRRGNRLIYRALEACPNLHLELSGYWLHRGIEYIVEHWGAQRLIFGSNWPYLGRGPTLTTLTTADIDAADKRLIAGDNLRRLMSWARLQHVAVDLPEPADAFARFGRTGERPAEMVFADNHGHLGGRACHYHLPRCDLAGIVADMDRLGIERICVFSFAGVFSDETHGNTVVAEAVAEYPDRFVGFTLLNPHRGKAAMIAELERGRDLGMRGVKLIPYYQGYPSEGPNIDVACRWAHDHRQIILNHSWGSVAQLERLSTAYPDACFFTGHATAAHAELMQRVPNIFVCSCPSHTPDACEALVRAIGAERLMFGSDLQDLPIAWGLGPILFARLPVADKRLILGGNLRRVLREYSLPTGTGQRPRS